MTRLVHGIVSLDPPTIRCTDRTFTVTLTYEQVDLIVDLLPQPLERTARRGAARRGRHGSARLGTAWRGRQGMAGLGEARRGKAGHGRQGLAWLVAARLGKARLGLLGRQLT